MVKTVFTDSRAPRPTTRIDRGLPGGTASAGAFAAAGSAARSTLYGLRSISLISAGLSSRASSAALLPESHSPHSHVAMEFGRRTAMTPGTSYASPHFGQRMSGIDGMIAEALLHSPFVRLGSRFAAAWRAFVGDGNGAPASSPVVLPPSRRRDAAEPAGVTPALLDTFGARTRIVVDRVDEQRAVIDDVYRSIDQLNDGIRKITDNVEALSASSEETSSSMLEMVASIEEVNRHTDTLFRAVEETASATEEMVSSINEVDRNAGHLAK